MAAPLDVPSMAGALLTTGRDATRELIGSAAYEKALGAVPTEVSTSYRRATPLSWVPVDHVGLVIDAMGDAAGRDALALQEDVVRVTMDRALKSIWRVFLRMTSNEALLSRLPLIYSKAYNRGRLVPTFPREDRAVIELCDWPTAPMHMLRSTRVGLEVTLHAAGRANARVNVDRTAKGAVFIASGVGSS